MYKNFIIDKFNLNFKKQVDRERERDNVQIKIRK